MSRADRLRLLDIQEAAETIVRLTSRGRTAYESDEAVRPAIERLLEIIGESAGAISEETRASLPGVNWQDLRRLRIVLAHHYHRIDPEQVWVMATEDVPELLERLQAAVSAPEEH